MRLINVEVTVNGSTKISLMDMFKVREKNQKRQEGGMHYNTLKTMTQTS